MKVELALGIAAIGLASFIGTPIPLEAGRFKVNREYPQCGSEVHSQNNTVWVVDVTEDGIQRYATFNLGPLPGQCGNGSFDNNLHISARLRRTESIGGLMYGQKDVQLDCFSGAVAFSVRKTDSRQGLGVHEVSGGLAADKPTFISRLYANTNFPDGKYAGLDTLQCQTPFDTIVPVQRINYQAEITD